MASLAKNEINIAAMNMLASRVTYDAKTGDMVWLKQDGDDVVTKRFNKRYSGKRCGNIRQDGYLHTSVCVNGRRVRMLLHCLAWYIVNGEFPHNEIDHINGIRSDNRISNLRCVSASINQRNRRMSKNNTSGVTGVGLNKKSGKWYARASINRVSTFLGEHDSIAQAKKVLKEFRAKNNFSENHGEPRP